MALGTYREAYDRLRSAVEELERLREDARGRERELDLLAYQLQEIEADRTSRRRVRGARRPRRLRLAHVEGLLERAAAAEQALVGDEAIADGVASLAGLLEAVADLDPSADDVARRARGLAAEVAELAWDVRTYREALLPDPERLQAVRERIAALKGLQRKYGPTDAEVVAFGEEVAERLAALSGSDDRIAALEGEVPGLSEEAEARARGHGTDATEAADALGAAVVAELEELGMPGSVLRGPAAPRRPARTGGAERAELWFSPSPSQPPAPLAKAASGGELSRAMLACRSVLADLDDVATVVFDEVDAGVGGQAGLAVGRRLRGSRPGARCWS